MKSNYKSTQSNNTQFYSNSKKLNNNTISYGPGSTNRSTKLGSSLSNEIPLNQKKTMEDDYISNLQKQIYYLELETKLMKDREIETKNKVGGYEILFRDGVPLNEHFLALKTKYTKEKDEFDNIIMNLENKIIETENENKYFENEIMNSQNNYDTLNKRKVDSDLNYDLKINDLKKKIINEKNLITYYKEENDKLSKELFALNSANGHLSRTIEKNNLFKENDDEKKDIEKKKKDDKFIQTNKLVERSLIEEQTLKRKYEKSSHVKLIEEENTQLITNINKLDREFHMCQAKITELENTRELNLKYLKDEAVNKQIHERENQRLNQDLESLGKLNEENLRLKVKENEQNQLVLVDNKIRNAEIRMNSLLNLFKSVEKNARDLLDEKNELSQELARLIEEETNFEGRETSLNSDILNIKNETDELDLFTKEKIDNNLKLEEENKKYELDNQRLEEEIRINKINIEELKQKAQLNEMLRDVDINELKSLTQNNSLVNQSINQIMSKWDKVYAKLNEIESMKKENN